MGREHSWRPYTIPRSQRNKEKDWIFHYKGPLLNISSHRKHCTHTEDKELLQYTVTKHETEKNEIYHGTWSTTATKTAE